MALPSPKDIVKLIKAKAFSYGDCSIPRSEARRRMAICANCPKLKEPETRTEKAALFISGGEFVCGICGCGVNLITVTRNDLLHEDTREQRQQRPEHCWHPAS